MQLLLGVLSSSVATAAVVDTDVYIYGGTSAGVIAAVQVAAMGKRVVLVEAGQHLGGMSVEGLVGTDIDNHKGFQNSPAVGGLTLEFYRRISDRYGRRDGFEEMLRSGGKNTAMWRFEPHVAEQVFNDWVRDAGVVVLRGHRLADQHGVTKIGPRMTAIHCDNDTDIHAEVFLDAKPAHADLPVIKLRRLWCLPDRVYVYGRRSIGRHGCRHGDRGEHAGAGRFVSAAA